MIEYNTTFLDEIIAFGLFVGLPVLIILIERLRKHGK